MAALIILSSSFAFAQNPQPHSPKADVEVSVPGTPQAKEAVIANSIPQTAEITRSAATLNVNYYGAPNFQPIEGTTMTYGVNTSTPFINVPSNTYYAVENSVWFTSAAATGPWVVATSVPPLIYTIPPSSPLLPRRLWSACSRTHTRKSRSGTYGNAYTGQSVSGAHGFAYNTNTGSGVAHYDNNTYADHDGNVYKYNPSSGWQQHSSSGWGAPSQSFNRSDADNWAASRNAGSSRWGNFHSGGWGGGFGGGGWADRGGGGFGGFRGGGFGGGSRR